MIQYRYHGDISYQTQLTSFLLLGSSYTTTSGSRLFLPLEVIFGELWRLDVEPLSVDISRSVSPNFSRISAKCLCWPDRCLIGFTTSSVSGGAASWTFLFFFFFFLSVLLVSLPTESSRIFFLFLFLGNSDSSSKESPTKDEIYSLWARQNVCHFENNTFNSFALGDFNDFFREIIFPV